MGETKVAVKKLLSHWLVTDTTTALEFEREVEILKKLRHPNIVLFFGAGTLEDNIPFLVTEYLPMGSLMSVFRSLQDTDFPMDQKLSFCIDAAAGMMYLHSLDPPHIHRDLKPQNLLVTSNFR